MKRVDSECREGKAEQDSGPWFPPIRSASGRGPPYQDELPDGVERNATQEFHAPDHIRIRFNQADGD